MMHPPAMGKSCCLKVFMTLVLCALVAGESTAAERDERAAAAAESAQAFLAKLQHEDGSFGGEVPSVSTTASVLLSFIASGSAPEVGRYGLLVRKAGEFLLKSVPEDGYIGKLDSSGMRGQSIVALALAEALAVETDAQQRIRIRMALTRLVGAMIRAQEVKKADADAGGVGQDPGSASSDALTTCGVVLALRAAANAGIGIPKSAFDGAAAYITRCAAPGGGFADRPGGEVAAITSYTSVVALSLVGSDESAALLSRSRELILRPAESAAPLDVTFFHLLAARLLPNSSWPSGWPADRDRIVAMQAEDGSFPPGADAPESARIYPTASALLALSTPGRLLMTFEK